MKKLIAITMAVVLLLAIAVAAPVAAKPGTVRVMPGSGTPIQDAIDAASDGDVIFVGPGTYTENVTVNKSVKIKGAGATKTTVQSPNTKTVFAVVASRVSISGFTIKGANSHLNATGVLIGGLFPGDVDHLGVSSVMVSKNIVENNGQGIYIWHSSGNTIVNNVVRYNSSPTNVDAGNGIIVWDEGGGQDINNLIKNNDVYYNYKFGIFVGGVGSPELNANGTKINGNKLYHNGAYGADYNWLGMGFMNAMGTISVHGNNVFPTASGLDYWVSNCPGLVLDGTPSYDGIPVPPAP